MFLNLAVAVGGHREFPNGAISNNYKKPWKNWATKVSCERAIWILMFVD